MCDCCGPQHVFEREYKFDRELLKRARYERTWQSSSSSTVFLRDTYSMMNQPVVQTKDWLVFDVKVVKFCSGGNESRNETG